MESLFKPIEILLEQYPNETYYGKPLLGSILKLVDKERKFEIFFNHCHRLGAMSGTCFNNELEFPNAILRRAKKVGAHQALYEIDSYLNASQIEIECALLLYKTHIEKDFEFSNSVRLTTVSNLIDSNLIEFLNKESMSTGGSDTALLIADYVTPKEYDSSIAEEANIKAATDWTKIEVKTSIINKLNDTRLILSLGRSPSYGVPVVGCFEIIPDHLQFLNRGIGYGSYSEPRTAFGPEIRGFEIQKANELLEKFDLLSSYDQARIRIALKRLNDAKIDSDWANKSINLRICLENLFCTEREQGIAKAISERSPLYTDFSKSRARKVYAFLSGAVHTGIPPEHATITEEEITNEVHKVIIKFIEEGGYPSWPTKKSKLQIFIGFFKSIFEQ